MRFPRLFIDLPLISGQSVELPKETTHYLLNVLRLRLGVNVVVFNGLGGEYMAQLVKCSSKTAQLYLTEHHLIERESRLPLRLAQAIARPEHMDYTIQKSVELGVQQIIPVITERSPPLEVNKFDKREQHWRKIIISACEQCGRNRLPTLHQIVPLSVWLGQPIQGFALLLSPKAELRLPSWLSDAVEIPPRSLTILIGPEGGLSPLEISHSEQAGYLGVSLGPRILRTETAAVATLAVCQAWMGDW